jgi:purine nucleoside phosphorylase
MSATFIVKTPIHGYSGMGYESHSHLEREFTDENEARKHLRRCNRAWELQDLEDGVIYNIPGKRYLTDAETEFVREMTEQVSFSFEGPSVLLKRTTVDEVIS